MKVSEFMMAPQQRRPKTIRARGTYRAIRREEAKYIYRMTKRLRAKETAR